MTTRSGRKYKQQSKKMTAEKGAGVEQLVRLLVEDRKRQDEEASKREERRLEEKRLLEEAEARREELRLDEKRLREETEARMAAEAAKDREQREREHKLQIEEMKAQMEAMRAWMEKSMDREEERVKQADARGELKLTKLGETEDIEAYLTTFERMMEVHMVKEERWVFRLAPLLTGKAQQAYAAMDRGDAEDYAKVKQAVLRRYNISDNTYRRRFRSAKRKDGETYGEMAIRMQDLVKRWMAECKTVEEVLEKMVVEQLIETMQTDLKVWVSERKPKSSGEAGELADDYMRARGREGARGQPERRGEPRRCHKCGREGHLARFCYRKSEDRPAGDRSVKREQEKIDFRKVKCYNCGGFGHFSTSCPERSLYCGEGQKTEDATTRKGLVEGKEVTDIVLDTGCSRTMVRQDLVRDEKRIEGEAVTVRCAHGDTVLYPLAEVEMELDGVQIRVKAAISERLPVAVLLGTDVPELGRLLWKDPRTQHTEGIEEAMVVKTRAQVRKEEQEEEEQAAREKMSGAKPNPIDEDEDVLGDIGEVIADQEEEMLGTTFADDMFQEVGAERRQQTRGEKRAERRKYGLLRAKDRRKQHQGMEMDFSREEMRRLQQEDDTLEVAKRKTLERTDGELNQFLEKDGLIYRHGHQQEGVKRTR